MTIDLIGYIATGLLAIAFVPQAAKVWKTKSVKDISITTFSLALSATILWVYYAYIKQEWPVLVVNALLFFNHGSILLCKILYDKK